MENGLNNMSVSEIRMVAFGDQKGMIMLSLFVHMPILMGHKQDLSPVMIKNHFLNSIMEGLIGETQQMVYIG